jgi:prepilin-type N-terminal cleavage/methylation domain-containing protein
MAHAAGQRGFTLIEVLIATVLIGLSIAALVAANGSFSLANVTGADLSTAEFLAEQIRELTTMLPVVDPAVPVGTLVTTLGPESGETTVALYDDVDDFNGFDSASLGAPISAQRTTLTDLSAFRQQVTVEKLNPANFNETKADSYTSNFVRVTVTILQGGRPISSVSWIRARY